MSHSAHDQENHDQSSEPDSPDQIKSWHFNAHTYLDMIIADDRWSAHIDEALQQDLHQMVIFITELISADYFTANLRWTDDAEMTALNAQFRQKDKPTNVLSFPDDSLFYDDDLTSDNDFPSDNDKADDSAAPQALRLGDLAFGFETMAREAQDMNICIAAHMRHLIIHGLLHLIGYDHETAEDAEEMEALEIAALAVIGVENPYQGELI
ncbi:MAG: rRNA maturation RNase YbeY [Candidatus Puniceispirillaceae bacterium]